MISLGHELGMSVVAEGAEDDATIERLEVMGCDYVQSYYFGRPVPVEELAKRLARRDVDVGHVLA